MLSVQEETLFIPLWCRAQASTYYSSQFYDPKAVEIVQSSDYDFSAINARLDPVVQVASVARATQCDEILKSYIAEHCCASIVNLGAGLDTGFYRVDNGLIEWYDLDLPNVIALREKLLPKTARVHSIAKSLLDTSWCDDLINTDEGVFAVAGAVFGYFNAVELKSFFSALADRLPGVQIVFTAYSSEGSSLINKSLHRVGMTDAAMKWALEDANELIRWDNRISVIDEFSFFKDIRCDPAWSEETIQKVRAIDEHNSMRIIHVKL